VVDTLKICSVKVLIDQGIAIVIQFVADFYAVARVVGTDDAIVAISIIQTLQGTLFTIIGILAITEVSNRGQFLVDLAITVIVLSITYFGRAGRIIVACNLVDSTADVHALCGAIQTSIAVSTITGYANTGQLRYLIDLAIAIVVLVVAYLKTVITIVRTDHNTSQTLNGTLFTEIGIPSL